VNKYHLYRSTTPYFYPGGTAYQEISNPGTGTLTFNDAVLGNLADNYFYALRAECTTPSGTLSAASDQVGKFEYELFETNGTDFAWVGLVLEVSPAITDTALLATHIQNNSTGSVTVNTISQWDAASQNYTSYYSSYPFTAFPTILKNAYRVEVGLPSTSVGSVIWAQVGKLPEITDDTYTLYETTGTDYTWVLQPLDMTGVSSTKSLANHIVDNSSGPVGVLTIAQFDGLSQNFASYDPRYSFTSFTTRFGYPYRVEVNVNIGNMVTWP
jgi:hypothetical protein